MFRRKISSHHRLFKIYIWKKICLPVCARRGRTQWLWVWEDGEGTRWDCLHSSQQVFGFLLYRQRVYHFMCLLISFLRFYKQALSLEPMLVTHNSFRLRFCHVQEFMNLVLMDFYSWVFSNLYPCKQFCNEYREGNVIFMNIIWCVSVRRVKGDEGLWVVQELAGPL